MQWMQKKQNKLDNKPLFAYELEYQTGKVHLKGISTRTVDPMHLLTHWGRVTHICVGNLTIIGSDNGLSPSRCQAIIWTNVEILLIGPLRKNFSEILIVINKFHSRKCIWKCRLWNGGHSLSASMCLLTAAYTTQIWVKIGLCYGLVARRHQAIS